MSGVSTQWSGGNSGRRGGEEEEAGIRRGLGGRSTRLYHVLKMVVFVFGF